MIAPEPVETDTRSERLYLAVPGVTTFASDEMLGDAMRLGAIHEVLTESVRALATVAGRDSGQPEEALAFSTLDTVVVHATATRELAESLWTSMTAAISTYSATESVNRSQIDLLSGGLAGLAGFLAGQGGPWLALLSPPTPLTIFRPDLMSLLSTSGDKPVKPEDFEFSPEMNTVLSDQRFVLALRYLVENSDIAIKGYGGEPADLLRLLEKQGVTGVAATAAIAVFYGSSMQVLAEGPVTVRQTATETNSAAQSVAEHGAAVPEQSSSPGKAQVRVDTIQMPGEPTRYAVYLAGTGDFSLAPGKDAFDTTSNVNAMAGFPTGSLEGIRQALAAAGVTSTDEVMIVGHSQGGLLAAAIAASGDYNVRAILGLGAPVGNIAIPSDVTTVLVENLEDPVPGFGGVQHNAHALTVYYDAFRPGEALPPGLAMPGHQMQTYAQALIAMDDAESPQITSAVDEITSFTAGATTVTSTYYRIDRVEP